MTGDFDITQGLLLGLIGVNLAGFVLMSVDALRKRMRRHPVANWVILVASALGGWLGVRLGLAVYRVLGGWRGFVFGRMLALSLIPAVVLWGVGAGLCLPDTWLGRQTAQARDALVSVFSPDDGTISLARLRSLFQSGPYVAGPQIELHPYDK